MRHGAHVGEVKKTDTQRCDDRSDVRDAGFVVIWRGDVSVDGVWRGGEGAGVG